MKPFTSQQTVVRRSPGVVWNGHVALLPAILGPAVHVHDAYILTGVQCRGDIAQGELMRYFVEAGAACAFP